MPRKGPAPKRPVVTDPVYTSQLVTQLVNKILLDGKKSTAESIVYGALEGCRQKTGTDPVQTLRRALDNVRPTVEVRSRRVGGATYQVPVEVRPERRRGMGDFLLGTFDYAFGRFTPYFERLRLRFALFVELGPTAPDASNVPRTTW